MSHAAVFCIANSREQTEIIVGELEGAGFRSSDISVLFPDKNATEDFTEDINTKAPSGAMTGAGSGGVIGGALGWAAGIGALAIPGAGLFLAVGPIAAAWSGAAIGATVGGIAGGLIGQGIPEKNASHYESMLKQGGSLISVHAYTTGQQHRAEFILTKAGGRDVVCSGEASRLPPSEVPDTLEERSTAAYTEAETSGFPAPHHRDAVPNDDHA